MYTHKCMYAYMYVCKYTRIISACMYLHVKLEHITLECYGVDRMRNLLGECMDACVYSFSIQELAVLGFVMVCYVPPYLRRPRLSPSAFFAFYFRQ